MRLQMDIIKAKKKDIPDIVFLNSFVQKIHFEKHPDIFKPVGNDDDLSGFFDSILSKEANCILVAYLEGTPVGYLRAAFESKPGNPLKYERRQVYIHQIVVHEGFRRQRVGKALFNKIQRIAMKEGIRYFALDTWAFNKIAQRFFENLGFDTYNFKMWRNDETSTPRKGEEKKGRVEK
jgi:ribosomal protein S18 acetylase RimI-like enzyme